MSEDPAGTLREVASFDPVEVERAMRRLPYIEREALLLKARDKLSYAEIAAVLGLTPAQAERRITTALVRLHARLTRRARASWRAIWPSRRQPRD